MCGDGVLFWELVFLFVGLGRLGGKLVVFGVLGYVFFGEIEFIFFGF